MHYDKEALKKVLVWPGKSFEELVDVLHKLQTYKLLDSKTNNKRVLSQLKIGKVFPITKSFFRAIAQMPPEFFSKSVPHILEGKVTLKDVVKASEKWKHRVETYKEICKMSGYSSEFLRDNSDKFSDSVLDSFEGAITGDSPNIQGKALEEYCKSVFEGERQEPRILFFKVSSFEEGFEKQT